MDQLLPYECDEDDADDYSSRLDELVVVDCVLDGVVGADFVGVVVLVWRPLVDPVDEIAGSDLFDWH